MSNNTIALLGLQNLGMHAEDEVKASHIFKMYCWSEKLNFNLILLTVAIKKTVTWSFCVILSHLYPLSNGDGKKYLAR